MRTLVFVLLFAVVGTAGRSRAPMSDARGDVVLKPKIAGIYRETFSQEELDGLIAFYESPVGRAYIAKMPVAMAKTMAMSQQQMQSLMPRLKAIADEARREAGKQ